MPVHDLSYQHWQGVRHDRPLALVLARAQVRAVLGRRIVRFLLLVSTGFTLAWGGMIYVETHVVRAGPLARIANVVTVDDQSLRNFLSRQRLVHLLLCLAAAVYPALGGRTYGIGVASSALGIVFCVWLARRWQGREIAL